MHKYLITEKPSVAMEFAKALHVSGRKDGYIENDEWTITWARGHLVTLSYPEKYDPELKKWSLDTLPFLPEAYKYEIIPDAKDQFKIVSALLNKAVKDGCPIYNAGDSGREGEYIQRLIFQEAKLPSSANILRVWIDSQTEDEIKRGIRTAKPSAAYDKLSDAAYMRAMEDYAFGINLSRALTCKFAYEMNKRLGNEKRMPIAVGRVMTCVLAMIVERENEIKNFVPTAFYRVEADHPDHGFTSHWKIGKGSKYAGSSLLYNDKGFLSEEEARKFVSELNADPTLRVNSCEKAEEKKKAPLLYNLAELQSECSKIYKISPDETLEIAQKLYEAKLTTYPRTDARVLSTAVAKEIDDNLDGLKGKGYAAEVAVAEKSGMADKLASSKYCDDSKITDHYAIIPTGQGDMSGLTDLDKKVYDRIVRRFLAIFYPAAVYQKTELELQHTGGELFSFSEKILMVPGYLELYKGENDEEKAANEALKSIKTGDVIKAEFRSEKGETKPPQRYTSGSMILAMENAGKLIEEEELREQIKGTGIGTSATRAEVIKKLAKNGYVQLNKKTQVLTPAEPGYLIYEYVQKSVPSMNSPKMTANWEKGLSQVENGEITKEKYKQILEKFIRDSVDKIKQMESEQGQYQTVEKKEAGKCPICGETLYESEKAFMCAQRLKGKGSSCQFGFSKQVGGISLPQDQIDKLLSGKNTDMLELVGKTSGKPYQAYIEIGKKGECTLQFPHEESDVDCPFCNAKKKSVKMRKMTYTYECPECKKSFFHTVGGKTLTNDIISKIYSEGMCGPYPGFKTKNGDEYSAYLLMYKDTMFVLKQFFCQREMMPKEVQELAKNGKIEQLDGFVGSKGTFQAGLKLDKRKGQVEFVFSEKKSGKRKK